MRKPSENVTSWREQILKEFTPKVARLTIAADPDGLLLEETLLEAIRERGFEILPFDNNVAFRFIYESRFRSRWDQGKTADLVVIQRAEEHGLVPLPHDILQASRQLSFSLGKLFPGISYPVVASLNRSDINALYSAWALHRPNRIGDDATKDFVLLHVFDITPALIKHPTDLLRVLLRKHYRGQKLPPSLDDRLVQLLRQGGVFDSWPLEIIVPDRQAFFSFLQERWSFFLDRVTGGTIENLQHMSKPFNFKIDGPMELPFDHDDVRIYMNNLFLEGMLRPVFHSSGSSLSSEWMGAGIQTDPDVHKSRRFQALADATRDTIPDPDARHHDWEMFAYRWAELGVLWSTVSAKTRSKSSGKVAKLRSDVDRAFFSWIDRRYTGLHNQPPDPPVMVHHVPRYLAQRLAETSKRKVALIVVDGLAIDQWIVLRDILMHQRSRLRYREAAVFAWVPTITAVSRQAIFAGKPPIYFPSSIHTTDKEKSSWTQFWVDQGVMAREVGYIKGLGDGSLDSVFEFLTQPDMRILGLVIDKVDKIMHGMELGTAGMHNQVRQWADEGFMAGLLDALFDSSFDVFLTSDHGNIEAEGCGRPSEGSIADVRGERVRVYSDSILRSRIKKQFPDAIVWSTVGLPEDYLALLAPGHSAFISKGKRIVGHGGASIEEIVVPMIQIERTPA